MVQASGEWKGIFNTMRKDTSELGMMGAAAITRDSITGIRVFYRKTEQRYFSNKVRVYHNVRNKAYKVEWECPADVLNTRVDETGGFTEFILKRPSDTVNIRISKVSADTGDFRLYGMQLLLDEPGLVYNTIGINGAGLASYLRCQLFAQHMSQQKPDMFIVSIGTNEANVDQFNVEEFEQKYSQLLDMVRSVNPQVAILLTVPNDAYYFKKYPNRNVPILRDAIYRLAQKYDGGVWDFFGIMGGFGSSMSWYKNNLMHKDRIHFTFEGYKIKGDLLYEAFLKFLDEYEFNRLVKRTNK